MEVRGRKAWEEAWDAYMAADKRLMQAKRLWWHGRRTATTAKALVKRKAISQAAWDVAVRTTWREAEAAKAEARRGIK